VRKSDFLFHTPLQCSQCLFRLHDACGGDTLARLIPVEGRQFEAEEALNDIGTFFVGERRPKPRTRQPLTRGKFTFGPCANQFGPRRLEVAARFESFG
jgi:hypothetical protein